MNINVVIEFNNIPARFRNRVSAIVEDGKITDAEMIELINMKLERGWPEPVLMTTDHKYVKPRIFGRIQRDRPLLRKLVWIAIVGLSAVIAAIGAL
jgi:hypothetical protein